MMNLVVDLQYFPSVTLYKNLHKFSNIVFDQYEHYQKMSFRSRCQIAGSAGVINLSVPLVKGRDQKTVMKDVRISDRDRWQEQHWKTILSCYSRSPWFEYYREELGDLYQKPVVFLIDWNLACFEWSLKMLPLSVRFTLTETWQKNYDGQEWIDWRGRLLPKNRSLSGVMEDVLPAGRIPEKLESYYQVFAERTGFLPGLSILDLLFCEGKRAVTYLK
jgi:hypothetical protein